MNVSDSEVVSSVLLESGMARAESEKDADVVFFNTCSVRENPERLIKNKVFSLCNYLRNRGKRPSARAESARSTLHWHNDSTLADAAPNSSAAVPKVAVGVLGCMAERLQESLVEECHVDLVAGPDAYRSLPQLLSVVASGRAAVGMGKRSETYEGVMPSRKNRDVTAFVSIMRGCDNFCSYCVVPFTRGRERSRDPSSIVAEVECLAANGVREITLLGQNVNSYLAKPEPKTSVDFTELLRRLSSSQPEVRFRFTSPHPKDFPSSLVELIQHTPNLCASVHLPAQSGSSTVLARMKRGYTREMYLDLVGQLRTAMPHVRLSTDLICGFCGETEAEHEETLELLRQVQFDHIFSFKYSERDNTLAQRTMTDDVPEAVKSRRLAEVQSEAQKQGLMRRKSNIGDFAVVFVDGVSKRSTEYLRGREDGNFTVIFPNRRVAACSTAFSAADLVVLQEGRFEDISPGRSVEMQTGDCVLVKFTEVGSNVFFADPLVVGPLTLLTGLQNKLRAI